MKIIEIYDETIFNLIITELRSKYGIKRKGDTYMLEERLISYQLLIAT